MAAKTWLTGTAQPQRKRVRTAQLLQMISQQGGFAVDTLMNSKGMDYCTEDCWNIMALSSNWICIKKLFRDFHNLGKFCRVCGGKVQKGKSRGQVHQCNKQQKALLATFGIGVASDDQAIHQQHFRHSCHAATKRCDTALSKGVPLGTHCSLRAEAT